MIVASSGSSSTASRCAASHIGSAAAGTVYDIIQDDKRKAIEIVVANKAEARDFERGEDDKDP